jgi:hypothetical protein
MRGVNYFRRLATTISAGDGQQGVSPTTWRHSVIVVGRLVAVEYFSAGAPEARRRQQKSLTSVARRT